MARIVTIPTAGVSNAMAAYTIGFARLDDRKRDRFEQRAPFGVFLDRFDVTRVDSQSLGPRPQSQLAPCHDRAVRGMLGLPLCRVGSEQSDTIAVRKDAIVEQDQPRHAGLYRRPKIGVWQMFEANNAAWDCFNPRPRATMAVPDVGRLGRPRDRNGESPILGGTTNSSCRGHFAFAFTRNRDRPRAIRRAWARALTATTVRPRSAAMSKTEALEMTSSRSRLSSSEVQAFALFSFFPSVSPGSCSFPGSRRRRLVFLSSALAGRLPLMLGPFLRRTGSRFSFADNRSLFSDYGLAGTISLKTSLSGAPAGSHHFLEVEVPGKWQRHL
jgi:hypothetical protein